MIAPVGEAEFGEEAVVALNRDSAARYPAFIAELELDAGRSAGYRQTGTLHVAVDADEQGSLEREFRYRQDLGLPVERLTSRQTRELEPGLAPSIRGGMLVATDHQVDPRAMIPTLLQACSRLGVQIHRCSGSLVVENGRAIGIGLDGGDRLEASHVVLAAGCWSGAVPGVPDADNATRAPREGADPPAARSARVDRAHRFAADPSTSSRGAMVVWSSAAPWRSAGSTPR